MKHQYPVVLDIGTVVHDTAEISFSAFDKVWKFEVRNQAEANIAKSCLSYYKPMWDGILVPPLCKDDVIADIGAHVGFFSVPISDKVNTVFSFEPAPANYELLGRNVRLNEAKNIRTFPYAVGATQGSVRLNLGIQGTTGHSISNRKHGGVAVEVQCITLKEIVRLYVPSVLKIDCEGAEWDILTDASLLHHIRIIVAELHKVSKHNLTAVTAVLEQAGMLWSVKHNSWFSKLIAWRK